MIGVGPCTEGSVLDQGSSLSNYLCCSVSDPDHLAGSGSFGRIRIYLKWLVTKKIKFFCRVSPISTRPYLLNNEPLIARVSGYFIRFVPFLHIFDRFLIEKGTIFAILNLNNWRLGRLKVHVIKQKKSFTDGGNPTKKFWVTSRKKKSWLIT